MAFTASVTPGVLHNYANRLAAFEYASPSVGTDSLLPTNFFLFLGGLGDGLSTVAYPAKLVPRLPARWAVVEVLLSSSYGGWATSSLASDAAQLRDAVAYFRALGSQRGSTSTPATAPRIVLCGHSTGSQISMTYVAGGWKTAAASHEIASQHVVDGVVLQAGISDREGVTAELGHEKLAASVELARQWVSEGRGADMLPAAATNLLFGPSSVSAARWLALEGEPDAALVGSGNVSDTVADDDFFSSDLPDALLERSFGEVGRRGVPLCVLLSGSDEYIPAAVDKQALLNRWMGCVKRNNGSWDERSGVVPGASHSYNTAPPEAVDDLLTRLSDFVKAIDGGWDGKKA